MASRTTTARRGWWHLSFAQLHSKDHSYSEKGACVYQPFEKASPPIFFKLESTARMISPTSKL